MKITATTPLTTPKNNHQQSRKYSILNQRYEYKHIELSDYPISYVKFIPSFGEKLSLEERDKKSQLIKDNADINDYLWALSWNKTDAKKEYELRAEKEIAIENKKKVFGINAEKKENIRNKYDDLFQEDLAKYNRIMADEESYKQKLQKATATDVRNITIASVMKNTRESLDKEIAGYSALKMDMGRKFLKPIKEELLTGKEAFLNNSPVISNCILLCGPTGCGKTLVAEAMANETSCTVYKIPTGTPANDFKKAIKKIMDKTKGYYDDDGEYIESEYEKRTNAIRKLKESPEYLEMTEEDKLKELLKIGSPRTVIIIDEFDKYFNKDR